MEMRYPFFNFALSDYQLSNDSLETVDQKQQNQLNYLSLNGKWKKATTDITTFPVNSNLVTESISDINNTTFFPNIVAVRAAPKEKREICPTPELAKRKSKMQQTVDGSNENDVDNRNEKREKIEPLNRNSLSFHYAFKNDSICSTTPSLNQSFRRSLENNTLNTNCCMQSLRELSNFSPFEENDSYDLNASNLNIIMLLGLIIGLLISKALQYLQSYFGWFLYQVIQLRNAFLGTATIWEFIAYNGFPLPPTSNMTDDSQVDLFSLKFVVQWNMIFLDIVQRKDIIQQMDLGNPFLTFGSSGDQLSKNSLETVKRKNKNQLHNLALSSKWKMSTTKFAAAADIAQETKGNIKKKGFFQNFDDIRAVLREERKMFADADVLNDQQMRLKRNNKMERAAGDSDDNDVDTHGEQKGKTLAMNRSSSFRQFVSNDSARSKTSSAQSFRESFLDDNGSWFKRRSSTPFRESMKDRPLGNRGALYPYDLTQAASGIKDLNLIMLLGLFIGLLVSKALQYLQLYIRWALYQIVELRNTFLGTTTLWEFLNLDDNTRLRVHTKLMLMPIIGVGTLVYGLASAQAFAENAKWKECHADRDLVKWLHGQRSVKIARLVGGSVRSVCLKIPAFMQNSQNLPRAQPLCLHFVNSCNSSLNSIEILYRI
uniref:Uncharacterized protein n=1 Tax=Glossina austeni TaxID=7395 RepID=A0A1A9VM74_GLOAU